MSESTPGAFIRLDGGHRPTCLMASVYEYALVQVVMQQEEVQR
jgi:hypothetical protein